MALFLLVPAAAAAGPPAGITAWTMDGKAIPLQTFKGDVVVLDFWASWCAPCRASFPFLDQLQARHAKGVRVIGLTLEEDEEAIRRFLAAVPAHFTILRDPSGYAGEKLEVVAMPTTILLDKEGRVAARFEGGDPREHAKIESAVETLAAGGTLAEGTGVRVAPGLQATGDVKAWQRGTLADPIMNLDGDPLERILREHIHASKEAAAGDGGATGGGCGCN